MIEVQLKRIAVFIQVYSQASAFVSLLFIEIVIRKFFVALQTTKPKDTMHSTGILKSCNGVCLYTQKKMYSTQYQRKNKEIRNTFTCFA